MKKREVWLDVLRVLAAFLVIVNHTNTAYQMTTPAQGTWWISIAWYVLSKVAVPIFIMISGACLLGREDSYRKCFGRFLRITGALLVFSWLHFAYNALAAGEAWPQIIRLDLFLARVQAQSLNDAYWYLYFYAGLMLMLPLLQRLSCALQTKDLLYLIAMSLGFGMFWPMLGHLVPALAMPNYLDPALFSALIGLFFLGWLLRKQPVPSGRQCILFVVFIAICTALSLLLLWMQFEEGAKYWRFMDDRMRPSPMIAVSAVCIVLICRCLFDRPMPEWTIRFWSELGQCSFAVYLVHQWLINETEFRIYYPLWSHMPAFFAGLVWEAAVFGLSLSMAFVIRRLPGFKKIV